MAAREGAVRDGPVLILYRTWQVCESGLNSFLQLAERLRVKGLCGMVGGAGPDSSRSNQSDNTLPLYRSAVCFLSYIQCGILLPLVTDNSPLISVRI